MHLVVGLGNPGPKYAGHRHNVGFMVLDRLADRMAAGGFRDKFSGEFAKTTFDGDDVVLLKPMTYMNLSGESVQKAMQFFKVALKDVIVVHDELDIPFGTSRIKQGGGTAGHNGLKSIVKHGGGDGFTRLRVGIDRPRSGRVEGYVLSDFNSSERAELDDVVLHAAGGVEDILKNGAKDAMNRFNQRTKN